MYKHKPLSEFQIGDLVEFNAGYGQPKGFIAKITDKNYLGQPILSTINQQGWRCDTKAFNLLDTKPGSTAQVGDTVCCINPCASCKIGNTFTVACIGDTCVYPGPGIDFNGDVSCVVSSDCLLSKST